MAFSVMVIQDLPLAMLRFDDEPRNKVGELPATSDTSNRYWS